MVCRMSRYEFYCPPPREWPARGAANFARLYDAAMYRVLPWRWMCSLIFMPGSPAGNAVRSLPEAALSREVNTI